MKRTINSSNIRRMKSDPYRFLKEFDNNPTYSCVRIEEFPQKNAKVCVASLRATLRKHRIYHIEIVRRGDVIYVFRKNCKIMQYT